MAKSIKHNRRDFEEVVMGKDKRLQNRRDRNDTRNSLRKELVNV